MLRLDLELFDRASEVAKRAGAPSLASWIVMKVTEAVNEAGVLGRPVSVLKPSTRLITVFERGGLRTLGDVVQLTPREFMTIRNAGETTLAELRRRLAEWDLKLYGDEV